MLDALTAIFDGNADTFPHKAATHFAALDNPNIPQLNVCNPPESFPDHTLVSFRSMVQDTSISPELYVAKMQGNKPGGWGLPDPDEAVEFDVANIKERTVLWAVSVPGESPWCSSSQSSSSDHKPARPARPHKYPIPNAQYIGVQVKICDPVLARGIQATDICTFIGLLSTDELNITSYLGEPEKPAVMVPTLHVLYIRETPPLIIPRTFPSSFTPDVRTVRNQLIDWIAEEALGGDKDAAEWVLLSTISKTYSRTPPIYPPSLTISSFPSPTASSSTIPTLQHVLTLILPLLTTLPLTLDTLNDTPFHPEDKKEDEDLHSGWLQVPKGSVYLITEAGITEGKVSPIGIHNINTVQNVMNNQTLDYEFPFSRFWFTTDLSFVVLAEGKKSGFFQTTMNVPLKKADGRNDDLYKSLDQIKIPSEEALDQWRNLVGGSKIGQTTISDETAEFIQDDFVKERRTTVTTGNDEQNEAAITPDDLIHWMITARLLALSCHEKFVTKEIWRETKALEARRKARI